jgi:hypothetical protein
MKQGQPMAPPPQYSYIHQTQYPAQYGYNQQNPVSADPFARVDAANPSQGGGVFAVPGSYPYLFIDALVMKQIRGHIVPGGIPAFIAEFCILQSNVAARPPGTRMSWIAPFDKLPTPGNVKAFLGAAFGISPNDVDSEGMRDAVSSRNPCHGRIVRLEAQEIILRSTGKPFTRCNWFAIPPEEQEYGTNLYGQLFGYTAQPDPTGRIPF